MPSRTIEQALADLRARPPMEQRIAPIQPRTHFIQRSEALRTKLDRAALKRLCKPENARELASVMPSEDCSVHALITGTFIFGDLLGAVIDRHGPPRSLFLASLSLSQGNVALLARLLDQHRLPIHFVISHYFTRTNVPIWSALTAVAEKHPSLTLRVARTHCKVALFDYPAAAWVIETSANLRSSGNLEQVTILHDRGLLEFHRAWMLDPQLPRS